MSNRTNPLVVVVSSDLIFLELAKEYIEEEGYAVMLEDTPEKARKLYEILPCETIFLVDYEFFLEDCASPQQVGRTLIVEFKEYPRVPVGFILMHTKGDENIETVAGERLEIGFFIRGDGSKQNPYRLKEGDYRLSDKIASEAKELRKHEKQDTDPLTGVLNRFAGEKKWFVEWNHASVKKTPIACIYADFNNFGSVNKTFGHDAGDLVIQKVAKIFHAVIRTGDFIIRMGGDEFFFVFPETDKKMAEDICQRIKITLAETIIPLSSDQSGYTPSVALGVAVLQPEELSTSVLEDGLEKIHVQIELTDRETLADQDYVRIKRLAEIEMGKDKKASKGLSDPS